MECNDATQMRGGKGPEGGRFQAHDLFVLASGPPKGGLPLSDGPGTATHGIAFIQGRPQRRLGRRLEEVAKAVGGGYCRLQMPLRLALGVRETVTGHRLGALEGGGTSPPSNAPPPFPLGWGARRQWATNFRSPKVGLVPGLDTRRS